MGEAPIQVTKFYRGQRFQTLSTHCQTGIVLSRVFLSLSSKNAVKLADFVENTSTGAWPLECSNWVLVYKIANALPATDLSRGLWPLPRNRSYLLSCEWDNCWLSTYAKVFAS